MKALFDTNILIDHLRDVGGAQQEFDRYDSRSISIISWMEVLAGTNQTHETVVRGFLANFEVLPLDDKIAEHAVRLRRLHRIKLPDAVIWATAQAHSMLLVTRNEKDFSADTPGVRIPYRHTPPNS